MQHFSKQLRTRLLTLYLSAGLVMGWLPGCGSQDLEIADTVAESAVTATADATDVITFSQPEGPEESTVYVEPVDGISDDFYRGMDVSAVLALENSGVKYYNFDGEEQDVFMTLAQAGVNYIRLRVWNDPYDENGNGYGGGNNDVATAITLGQRATQYGMKVCIDFHYSDFWADPKKQFVPKAWEGMDIEEKSDALYNFTLENLTQILDAGVDVGMVQVGNEINNGMCGETDASNVRKLLASGSKAVRDAAYLRAKEDYLMGINFSRALTLKYGNTVKGYLKRDRAVISVGRVMTCVLGMIVNREREIRSFTKTPFYRVIGNFKLQEKPFTAEWRAAEGSKYYNSPALYKENGFKKKEDAERLIAELTAEPAGPVTVTGIEKKKENKNAPLLYNLAELQNDCSKYFKISPDETLRIVQELYEKKMTTYPRTDARVLSTAQGCGMPG